MKHVVVISVYRSAQFTYVPPKNRLYLSCVFARRAHKYLERGRGGE